MKTLISCLFILLALWSNAQEKPEAVYRTFKSRHIINANSIETLEKYKLDVRIAHRFGDLAGQNGGWNTFFGLENAADILIGAEYGLTNNLTIGLNRTKGAGPLRALINGFGKYKILSQTTDNSMPISLGVLGLTSWSTARRSSDSLSLSFFPNYAHRFSYAVQVMIAKKFGNVFSLQLTPGYIHRNVVNFDDENDIFSLGLAARFQVSKVVGVILDATYPISSLRMGGNGFHVPIGIGVEIETGGGHIFQINLTNARGLIETDYIPYTRSNWLDGGFRLGFTISRLFNL